MLTKNLKITYSPAIFLTFVSLFELLGTLIKENLWLVSDKLVEESDVVVTSVGKGLVKSFPSPIFALASKS